MTSIILKELLDYKTIPNPTREELIAIRILEGKLDQEEWDMYTLCLAEANKAKSLTKNN